MKYEYWIQIIAPFSSPKLELKWLNKMGDDGWQHYQTKKNNGFCWYYFKRVKTTKKNKKA